MCISTNQLQYPKIVQGEIKGTKLHRTRGEPGDLMPVISIRFLNDILKRIGTGHVHEDGIGSRSSRALWYALGMVFKRLDEITKSYDHGG